MAVTNKNTHHVETDLALDILLVEDNPAHAQLITRWLSEYEVFSTVLHVSDGEAALDYLFHRGEYSDVVSNPRPRMILLDLRLPRIDGVEVLAQIRATQSLADIPVIVLTTSAAQSDIASVYEYQVNSYLVKPMDYEKFKTLMHDIAHYWLSLNKAVNHRSS